MSLSTSKKKSSLPMLIVFLVIVVAGGGYYYYVSVLAPTPVAEVSNPIPVITTVNWDKQLYQDPSYSSLVDPLKGPVEVGPMGNPQPFVQLAPSEARK